MYDKLGASMLNEMDGMFVLAILDRKARKLFIARDRAGKKPLYYYHSKERFVFASELNALHHQLSLEMNEDYIFEFLRTGFFYQSHTPYKRVHELPAASFATVNLDGPPQVQVIRWWDIQDYYEQPVADDEPTALARIDDILKLAIKRRVESSDLEVGSFLAVASIADS